MTHKSEVCSDPYVEANRQELLERSRTGLRKYGVGLDRNDLTPAQWAQHGIEELLDGANYLRRLKHVLEEQEKQIEILKAESQSAKDAAHRHADALWSAQFYLRHAAFQDFSVNRMLELLGSTGVERKPSEPESPVFDGLDCVVQGALSEGG